MRSRVRKSRNILKTLVAAAVFTVLSVGVSAVVLAQDGDAGWKCTAYAADEPSVIASGYCGEGNCCDDRDGEKGHNITYTLYDNGVLELSGQGQMCTHGNMPWRIDGYSSYIKKVIIGEGITDVERTEFSSSTELTEIVLPESLETIGDMAFYKCTGLKSITIPKNVTSIGNWIFYACTSLTDVTISEGVTEIGEGMFQVCTSLESIEIPGSVTSIGMRAFEGTRLKKVTIPGSVTSIGYRAFGSCTSLDEVTILAKNLNLNDVFDDDDITTCYGYYESTTEKSATISTYFVDVETGVTYYKGKLSSPTTSVDMGASGAVITWTAVEHAGGYSIYRAEYNNDEWGEWKELGTTDAAGDRTYTDTSMTSGVQCVYMVRAFSGRNYSRSFHVDSWVKYAVDNVTAMYLPSPAITASVTVSGVKIAWSKAEGAEGYVIYRKLPGGKWKKLKSVSGSDAGSYTDTLATSGSSIQYKALTYNGDNYSSFSAAKTVTYLATPTVRASVKTTGVRLTWTKITGAKEYTIYRKQRGGTWKKLYTTTSAKTAAYTDKKAVSGKVYAYAVRAVSGSAQSSMKSSGAIRYLKAPTVKAVKKSTGIKLRWTKTAGAKGYIVYRKAKDSKTWTRIKTIRSAKTVTCLDKKAKKGKTYTYTVKAYYGKSYSAVKSSKSVKR